MILEQKQVSDCRYRPHYLLYDILHDVVRVMGDLVLPGAAV